jgi:hypothetical protein
MIAFAAMLLAAAFAGWIVVADISSLPRAYARFAFVLYAALAVAIAADVRLADSVTLIVSSVAPMLLAFAVADVVRKPVATAFASVIMASVCISGLVAAALGYASLAFAPLLFAIVGTIAVMLTVWRETGRVAIQIIISACALLAGASAAVSHEATGQAALCAFTSAGLLGVALSMTQISNAVVEKGRDGVMRGARAIRSFH